ncbi:MAG: hypothetical protein IKQ41_00045, partial [Clostridia bacterium]|nr:hypothetical protein [Clostridia bacterium]
TCDPIDVNDVLYQLSHATIYMIRFLGLMARATSTDAHRIGKASRLPLFNGKIYYAIICEGCQGLIY